MLRPASELKTVADSLDLTPILSSIGDTLYGAAQDGLYETNVTIKDSVYAGRLAAIGQALSASGYAIGFLGNDSLQISWATA